MYDNIETIDFISNFYFKLNILYSYRVNKYQKFGLMLKIC